MCGIFGIWNRDGKPLDLARLQQATTRLRHRGPDDEGYLLGATAAGRTQPAAGRDTVVGGLPPVGAMPAEYDLGFGFRRLAILDPSPLGHQPMASADGRRWIVFNGEIYNYRELRAELAARGYVFRGGSDTEVILAAYDEWGPACLQRFNGMWAFAIWDVDARSLFLARDRFGVKPLYYRAGGARFAFASEIKALVGLDDTGFRPDDAALYAYLVDGTLPSARAGDSFFEGVRALPAGHHLHVTGTQLRQAPYYELPADAAAEPRRPDDVVAGYRELFEDAVRLRLRSDVPVGSCLSGGLDSSAIVCVVNRLVGADAEDAASIGDRQKTFTAVYETEGRFNERAFAERVLQATGAERNFVVPTAERLDSELTPLIWHQDEPFGSTSIFAQWCVMAEARARGVTVLLDGQGADEALGGYRPYEIYLADLLRRGRLPAALAAGRRIDDVAGTGVVSLLARALARQLPAASLSRIRRRREAVAARALRPDFAAAVDRGAAADLPHAAWDLHAHYRQQITETSLPHLLRHEDRNSMAFSVEGRVPFLDYRLVEFSLRQAHRLTIRDGWTKWVLRRAMERTVPDEIVWRRDKVGFETPEREWLGALLASRQDLFADGARVGAYLDLAAARAEAKAVAAGGGSPRRLWRWINTELWLRAFSAPATAAELALR